MHMQPGCVYQLGRDVHDNDIYIRNYCYACRFIRFYFIVLNSFWIILTLFVRIKCWLFNLTFIYAKHTNTFTICYISERVYGNIFECKPTEITSSRAHELPHPSTMKQWRIWDIHFAYTNVCTSYYVNAVTLLNYRLLGHSYRHLCSAYLKCRYIIHINEFLGTELSPNVIRPDSLV